MVNLSDITKMFNDEDKSALQTQYYSNRYTRWLELKLIDALNAAESAKTSTQYIKANVRSVAGILNAAKSGDHPEDIEWCVNKLREILVKVEQF